MMDARLAGIMGGAVFLLGVLIGIAAYEADSALVDIDALDETCKRLTGDDSAVFVDEFGKNLEFVCSYNPKVKTIMIPEKSSQQSCN